MSEMVPKYTQRQIDLIKGVVLPADNDEWNYMQDHANDVLPKEEKPFKPFGKLTGEDLDKNRWEKTGSTQAGHIGEALDRND